MAHLKNNWCYRPEGDNSYGQMSYSGYYGSQSVPSNRNYTDYGTPVQPVYQGRTVDGRLLQYAPVTDYNTGQLRQQAAPVYPWH
jgi:hypothetical protein